MASQRSEEEKIAVFGGPQSGRSILILRLTYDIFHEHYDPTISDSPRFVYGMKSQKGEISVLCEMVDTKGMDQFLAMKSQFYCVSTCGFFVFGINSKDQLEDALKLKRETDEARKEASRPPLPSLLIGTKSDLRDLTERCLTEADCLPIVEKHGFLACHFVSAKTQSAAVLRSLLLEKMLSLKCQNLEGSSPSSKSGTCILT